MSKRGKGQRCTYCRRVLEAVGSRGILAATRDHTHPAWDGGKTTVWACRFCNCLKGPVTMEVWEKFMAENPNYWWGVNRDACNRFRRMHNAYLLSLAYEEEPTTSSVAVEA